MTGLGCKGDIPDKNLLVAMTTNIAVPPFPAASFFHLSQIEALRPAQDLVLPLHEDSVLDTHTKYIPKGSSEVNGNLQNWYHLSSSASGVL